MSHVALIDPLKDAGKRKLAYYLARFEASLSQVSKGKSAGNYKCRVTETTHIVIFHSIS